MAFWNKWLKKETAIIEKTEANQYDRELIMKWLQDISHSIVNMKVELSRIPMLTAVEFDKNLEDRTMEIVKKLDELPERIVGPVREVVSLSKHEILNELMRISSHYDAHHSNDSGNTQKETIARSFQEISRELTGKQKRLLALLLDSGFLSYAEIGDKLGITHESAKNFVNRLLRDEAKARLLSKQDTEEGVKVGVSHEIQDEILKEKYRTKSNDSN